MSAGLGDGAANKAPLEGRLFSACLHAVSLACAALLMSWGVPGIAGGEAARPAESDEAIKKQVAVLIRDLGDGNEPTWRRAADELMKIGTPAVPALVEFLGGKDENVCSRAGQVLINIHPAPVSALVEALGSQRADARARAAWVLGSLGFRPEDKEAVPSLVKALEKSLGDEDPKVRLATARALYSLGRTAAAAEPALRKALADKDKTVRIHSAVALGSVGADTREAVAVLAKLLDDEDPNVRGGAAWALGGIGPDAKETIKALARLLGDRRLGTGCGMALGRIGPVAIPVLSEALRSKDGLTRANAVLAFAAMERAARDVIPALVEILANDRERRVRDNAARALGGISLGERAAVLALLKALDDTQVDNQKERPVASTAHWALRNMGASAAPALAEALADPNANMRVHAAETIAESRAAAQAMIPALEKALGDEDSAVRRHVARALGSAGAAAAKTVPALSKLLEDKDESVQLAAKHAIELIRRDTRRIGAANDRP